MKEPRELTIVAAINLMRRGDLTAQELVKSCLERIHQREGTIHAWVEVYEDEALEEARRYDNEFRRGQWRGELHGIPIGVKDIIDVKGMWTRAGCSVYPACVAEVDAQAVQRLRAAGAIILGKTETTPFANLDPTITRNPWNPEHTPGGSSSGSGAAVADRMCLAALGTQTGGSLLRPAAYNGIVGFKPSYGYISLNRVIPVAWSLDHIGSHTRCVDDAKILCQIMKDDHPSPFARMPMLINNPGKRSLDSFRSYPRLGYMRGFFETEASPEVVKHLTSIREKFEQAGAIVVDLELPKSFAQVNSAHRTIHHTELACYHRPLFESYREQYPPKIKTRIEEGMTIPGYQYVEALHHRLVFQKEMGERLSSLDAAVMPTVPSTAPGGLASTGSPAFCQPWSFSGFPAISIPSGVDNQGLPFAIQLLGLPMAEKKLIEVASWCEQIIAFNSSPVAKDST
jgi:aspartyl-tRNA(Asn)/glutamyl-tRNA(Gln) amidotransferase subunit A